ncbi:MAG: hypothetical protein NT147_03820 [Candidatus Aminicenantes bacterium]|nr:hypothetical protein [Candidatus Aminicenantes bacterium]
MCRTIAPGNLFPNEDKFIPPWPAKVKKKLDRTGSAQPFLLTLPDLDEELEDLEGDELDRPDEEERFEEDPLERVTPEECPEEEPLDLGALTLRPEEPLGREGVE